MPYTEVWKIQQMNNSRIGKRYAGSCDIEDYINEELLDRVGGSHYNSAISGTMTGLGILGTFIGLSLGLGSFSGDDIYTISDNVGPLLSGMKVAWEANCSAAPRSRNSVPITDWSFSMKAWAICSNCLDCSAAWPRSSSRSSFI